jgi:predicted dienelactone hydrolase
MARIFVLSILLPIGICISGGTMKFTVSIPFVSIPIRCASVLVVLVLVACNPATTTVPQDTATLPRATATLPQATATKLQATTIAPQTTATVPQVSLEPGLFPLSESGLYHVGTRTFTFEDTTREGREVGITVWYPALQPQESTSSSPIKDASPDLSGAPYPLILSSTKVARIFAPYLISHGFTWASVDRIDTYKQMNQQIFEQPLDILFALGKVASSPPEGLEGMIDAEHDGAIGYSFDGYNVLAMSGARIDPEYYLAQCPNPDVTTEAVLSILSSYNCDPALVWDEFVAQAGEAITTSEDGLWQPMTDERIRAVMPLAGEGWWLFGERGLAAVDRPALIIVATEDELYPENTLIFEHMGTPEKALISFIGKDHFMVYEPDMVSRMAHFAVAFFGYHLQGRDDWAEYFSEDFVAQHDDLAWGVDGTK